MQQLDFYVFKRSLFILSDGRRVYVTINIVSDLLKINFFTIKSNITNILMLLLKCVDIYKVLTSSQKFQSYTKIKIFSCIIEAFNKLV